jgi:hypothetical protein
MSFTNYADQQIINAVLADQALGNPSTWQMGLSTTAPSQVKGGATPYWNFTEPTSGTGGYGRLAVAANTTNWGAVGSPPTDGYSGTNLVAVTFPGSSAAWASGATPLVAIGWWDSATVGAGNLWIFAPLAPTVTVSAAGVTVLFPASALVVTND